MRAPARSLEELLKHDPFAGIRLAFEAAEMALYSIH